MNVHLNYLVVRTRKTTEKVFFSRTVTFLYGPIGKGKSTVARLIDYCFGGELERTPAIQSEFVAVTLGATIGEYECTFERGADDTQVIRVTWTRDEGILGSINAPLAPSDTPLIDAEVYNLSDLIFYFSGVDPIKVLQRSRDPESKLIRLSFRDIWWYCYLDQTHLDSSFFRLEDPYRGRKSQDAMRFFTGIHSERLNQLQAEYYKTITEQQVAREAVKQIRSFMTQFVLGSEMEVEMQVEETKRWMLSSVEKKKSLERDRQTLIHPTDSLREQLRELSASISDLKNAESLSLITLAEEEALRAEFITTKVKSERAEQANRVLGAVEFCRCPECNFDISNRPFVQRKCRLCGTATASQDAGTGIDGETLRREINDRVDQISDSIYRRKQALDRTRRQLESAEIKKRILDKQLQDELKQYDSAFVETIRAYDREIATSEERLRSLRLLGEMARSVGKQEERAGILQGPIDRLRSEIEAERSRLKAGDKNAIAIAERFKSIMLAVGFPGVSPEDDVILDPRNWKPTVVHFEQEWGFWDTGSGGKKTLFNVCYALALHEVARERGMPVPNVLIIDSPTKNISDEENPELVRSLYREIYRVASERNGRDFQFLLIDSDLVLPLMDLSDFSYRHMAGVPDAPSLISYYDGP